MNSKKIIFIFLPIVLLSSCTKEFLDVNNTQQLYRESYVKDLATMQDYVRGIYYRLSFFFESREADATYSELVADNLRPVSSTSSPATAPLYNWNQSALGGASALNMNAFWSNSYLTIRMCNFVIEEINNYRGENTAKADDIKGQAYAIRALIYFKMVNVFAQPYNFTSDASHPGVPYIITSDITKPYSRQSVAQVYNSMISDLNDAIQLFPDIVPDTRYINKIAAKALLARTYLFKEDYANAKLFANEVTNQVPLMTISNGYPNDVFKFKSTSNTETLFQLSPGAANLLGRWVRSSPIKYLATNDIANILKEYPGDARIIWINSSSVGWNVTKFPTGVATEANPAAPNVNVSYYPAIIRSSEMFLTLAEAAAKTNDENTARTFLNALRKRANPSIANDVIATGQALLDSIYKERRKELAFEGLRMFDLLRWKKGISRIDALPGAPSNLSYPSDKAISPIPEPEVRVSGIPQNTGY